MAQNPYPLIIGVSLLLGFLAGVIMHRADFCVVCAFRNFFLFGNTFLLRCLALLIVATMALFEIARQLGLISLYPFPLLGPPSAANVAGGFLFGIGMVLAGGCVVGTLYKMGSGSFLSFLAFLGLISGSALYAEIHPWWSSLAAATTFFRGSSTIPQLLAVDPLWVTGVLLLCSVAAFARWARSGALQRRSPAAGYLQPWQASLFLACLGTLSYIIVGMPFGVTTAYTKMGAFLEQLVAPGHVERLAYFSAVPLDYTLPFSGVRLTGGGGPHFDAVAAIQFPLIAGVIGGGACSALLVGEFRVYPHVPYRQGVSAVVGGMIMGMASRMAPACSVWHLFGGLPVLAWQSILFLLGLVPGAFVGSRLLARIVVR